MQLLPSNIFYFVPETLLSVARRWESLIFIFPLLLLDCHAILMKMVALKRLPFPQIERETDNHSSISEKITSIKERYLLQVYI